MYESEVITYNDMEFFVKREDGKLDVFVHETLLLAQAPSKGDLTQDGTLVIHSLLDALDKHSEPLKECPFCTKPAGIDMELGRGWRVICKNCKCEGPESQSYYLARILWDAAPRWEL